MGSDVLSIRDDSLAIILLSPTNSAGSRRASQDRAGLFNQSVQSPPVSSGDAAAPAHRSVEDG